MGEIDLCYASISDLSRDFGRGALSPVEVTRAHLERIDRLNPMLEAYATVLAENALADARRVEEGSPVASTGDPCTAFRLR